MNLCLYSPQQEENIYIRKQARTWQRSGLITNDQLNAILGYTNPDVRQTNVFFRVIFFIFTYLCAGALLGLFMWITDIRKPVPVSSTLIIAGIISYFSAEYAVTKFRFYRHGIEEALALMAMLFFCLGCGGLLSEYHLGNKQTIIAAAILCAVLAYWISLRFGFLYASFISIVAICLAAVR